MNCLTEELFNFVSLSKILKIIIIFTLFLNINCGNNLKILMEEDEREDVSIIISPSAPSVILGDDLQFTATLHNYSDGLTEDVTSAATWTITNTAVAIISNSAGSEGLATGMAVGVTKIKATLDTISNTTSLTIIPIVDYQVILNGTTEKSEWVHTAVLDNQGRLLIGGKLGNANWDAAIWRYNRNGTPDTSFGTNGVVSWNSPENNTDYVDCIKVKPDGTILLGGVSYDSLNDNNAFLGRLLPDGQPDTGLSPDGFKYVDIDRNKISRRVTLTFDSSDRLLFSGITTLISPWVVGIARITTSGIIDTTFSNMGYFTPPKPAFLDYEGGIIVDSGYIYKVVKTDNGVDSKIYKLNESDGSQVDLIEGIPINACHWIAIHGDYLYIGGYLLSPERYAWAKINKTDFTYDLGYGNNSIGDGSPQTDGGRGCHLSVNTNGEVYIGGTSPFFQDGMIIKANTLGSVDTSWGTLGAIPYVSVGGVDGEWDNVSSTVFYEDKIFIFGNTVTEINSTLYYKIFIHHTNQ